MKNLCLILIFLSCFHISLSQIQTPVSTSNGDCYTNTFTFSHPTHTPPYYRTPPETGNYPIDGYSYFWYTNDGQVSCSQSPSFSNRLPTPHQPEVGIVLTPRKKGQDDLKIPFIPQEFPLTQAIGCETEELSLDMWSDMAPKPNDKLYLVVPIKRCDSVKYQCRIDYNSSQLTFNGNLPLFNSTTSVSPLGSSEQYVSANGQTMNQRIDAIIDFEQIRYDVSLVLEFTVNASALDQIVDCHYSDVENDDCNPDRHYSQMAKGGPYDPNFLTPTLPEGNNPCVQAGDTIFYHLQFQNEGNGSTAYVNLQFNLDSRLDPATFKVQKIYSFTDNSSDSTIYDGISYSTTDPLFTVTSPAFNLADPSVKGLSINPIVLTPMSTNYTESIGYVEFYAVARQNLLPGQELNTITEVFFNDLPPVQTNIATIECPVVIIDSSRWWEKYKYHIAIASFILLAIFSRLFRRKPKP
jgi:hypothetical protein